MSAPNPPSKKSKFQGKREKVKAKAARRADEEEELDPHEKLDSRSHLQQIGTYTCIYVVKPSLWLSYL